VNDILLSSRRFQQSKYTQIRALINNRNYLLLSRIYYSDTLRLLHYYYINTVRRRQKYHTTVHPLKVDTLSLTPDIILIDLSTNTQFASFTRLHNIMSFDDFN